MAKVSSWIFITIAYLSIGAVLVFTAMQLRAKAWGEKFGDQVWMLIFMPFWFLALDLMFDNSAAIRKNKARRTGL